MGRYVTLPGPAAGGVVQPQHRHPPPRRTGRARASTGLIQAELLLKAHAGRGSFPYLHRSKMPRGGLT